MGRTPQKTERRGHKKGGSTQSRPNLTNHHYKEPEQNTFGAENDQWGVYPKSQFVR